MYTPTREMRRYCAFINVLGMFRCHALKLKLKLITEGMNFDYM